MMRNFTLFTLILIYSRILWSQTNGGLIEDEKALNAKLLQNSVQAQQNLESQGKAAPTTINILSNGGSSTTSSTKNLTDQDKQMSEHYVHQGKANRIIQEKCVGEMAEACSGNEVNHKVMGMDPGLIKAATAAYASFGAMSDSILPLTKKPEKEAAPKDGEVKTNDKEVDNKATDKEKSATDYCKYFPAVTEAAAMVSQKNSIAGIDSGAETSQKEALMKAAKSHEERGKNAQIQAAGWFGGAACYALRISPLGSVTPDKNLWIKLASATLLGTFYQEEVSANQEYADKTREIARSLPGLGDCNPITQTACYCSQPETENDPRYCKAQIAAKIATTPNRIACTDNKMQLDPNCNCEKSNSCFDKFIENVGAVELNLGSGLYNSPFKSIASLAHGKLEAGTLNGSSSAGMAAIAKRALAQYASKVPDTGMLTPAQKAMADAIASKGIPASIARLMAKNPPPQSEMNKAMAKVQGLGSNGSQVASLSPGAKSNVLDFSGGNGLGTSGKKVEKKNGMEDFMGKLNPKTSATNNGRILEFAQKAQASAPQITKADRPLFEIISLRYQTSGRKLLQLDM
nr:hypothetical protein [Bacteriovorax sp.]